MKNPSKRTTFPVYVKGLNGGLQLIAVEILYAQENVMLPTPWGHKAHWATGNFFLNMISVAGRNPETGRCWQTETELSPRGNETLEQAAERVALKWAAYHRENPCHDWQEGEEPLVFVELEMASACRASKEEPKPGEQMELAL